MTQEPQKSNSVGIIIAVIGVTGAIIAAIITVVGNYNVEKMRQEAELTRIALASNSTQGEATQTIVQNLLLRGSCRSDYVVNANEPIRIYYGGWFVKGIDLAQDWTTALDVSISVDGTQVSGEQHPPVEVLPFNCTEDKEDIYWLYYTTTLSKFSPGVHEITVTFNILRELPDGLGENYVTGKLGDFTFKVTAK